MTDLVGPRAGDVRRGPDRPSNWAVKSRSKLVVSFSLRDRREVGEGVLSERRTVEGVIGARARGVDCEILLDYMRRDS